jgi:hypothetical protein
MMVTFYATIGIDELKPHCIPAGMDVPIMLPASSYARGGLKPPRLPSSFTNRAADCGGFVATFRWGGQYRYTPEQYVTWLHTWNPQWGATMDFCCEDEITGGKPGIVRERQQKTSDMAHLFWFRYRDVQWAWVPTIQGWEIDDYRRHAQEMKPLIDEMHTFYGADSFFRVGIGTLCRRASSEMIRQVALAVAQELGDVPLHLWGIKLGAMKSPLALPEQVASVDSAAFWFHDGGWQVAREKMHVWAQATGKTHRHYLYEVALPSYQAKIDEALSVPKQAMLF